MSDEEQFMEPEDEYIIEDEPQPTLANQQSSLNSTRPFKIVPIGEILNSLDKTVDQVEQVLMLGKDWDIIFLNACRWSTEKCFELFSQGIDKVHQKINYTPQHYEIINQNKVCEVCAEPSNAFLNMGCGHTFCINCYKDYIISAVGSKVVFFGCMQEKCKAPVRHSLIEKLLESIPSKLQLYHKYLGEKFVENNSNMKFCTGADCDKCISSKDINLKDVKCQCGTRFCFKCREQVHRPCQCFETKNWKDIVDKEEANAKWLSLHTKICPFCSKHVERSTGCNFMMCAPPGGCGKAFCYVCSRPWQPDHKDHFKCNVYKSQDNEQQKIEKEKQILQKINFYCEKYLSNQYGANKLKEFLEKAKQMQQDFFLILKLDLIDTQFIYNVYQFTIEACNILKWSYAFRFYLKDNSIYKDIFDARQGDFEKFKENLLFKLETKLVKLYDECRTMYKKGEKIDIEQKRKEFAAIKEEIQSFYKSAMTFMDVLVKSVQNEMI